MRSGFVFFSSLNSSNADLPPPSKKIPGESFLIDEIRYNIEEKKAVLDFFWNSNPMFESEATHEAYHLEIARQISELYPDEIILMKYLKD